VLSFFFELRASCICPVYYGLCPFALFQYTLLIKKKKNHNNDDNNNKKNKNRNSNSNNNNDRAFYDWMVATSSHSFFVGVL
jgi:hypothetical protein